MNNIRKLAVVSLLMLSATLAMASKQWTAQGGNLFWGNAYNWSDFATPAPGDIIYFEDLFYSGYTNAPGAVNNIVTNNTTVGEVHYTAFIPFSGANSNNSHYYTTLITNGATLNLGGMGGNNCVLSAGDVPDQGSYDGLGNKNYSTITGSGSLNINEPQGSIYVGMGGGGNGSGTLDMGGLNSFTANLGILRVMALNEAMTSSYGWGRGILFLARTNLITAQGIGGPGVLLGTYRANVGQGVLTMILGQQNVFNADGFTVGGAGSYNSTVIFSNYPNSTFKLRGTNGISPTALLTMGDLSADVTSYNPTWTIQQNQANAQLLNLTGGTADIMADTIMIGRSSPSNTPTPASGVNANGVMMLGNGSVSCTNLYIAHKIPGGTNVSTASGTLILLSNTVFNVAQNLYAIDRTNSGGSSATIVVSNNSALNVAGKLYVGLGSSGCSISVFNATNTYGGIVLSNNGLTLNLYNNGLLNLPGSITNLGSTITLTNGGRLSMTTGGNLLIGTIVGDGFITNAGTLTISNGLSAGLGNSGQKRSLYLGNNVILATNFGLTFDLSPDTTVGSQVNDYIKILGNVAFPATPNPITLNFSNGLVNGTYVLMEYASKSGATPTLSYPTRAGLSIVDTGTQLQLVVTGIGTTAANLVWRGTNGSAGNNWNINLSNNWFNAGSSSLDVYKQLDNVTFDDTGVSNIIVIASNVQPGSVTFNNSSVNYTNSSTSKQIAGPTGLTKNGTANLALNSGNDFFGPVQLNGGITEIGNSSAFNTSASTTGTVSIASGAALDLSASSIGSTTSARKYTIQGTGLGAATYGGVIFNTNGSSGTAVINSGITLVGNATVVFTNPFTTASASSRLVALQGMTHPSTNFGINTAPLNLGGNTLTVYSIPIPYTLPALPFNSSGTFVPTGAVQIVNMFVTNGTIDVKSGVLNLGSSSGPGFVGSDAAINLADGTYLRLNGYSTFNNATGYVAGAVNVASKAAIIAGTGQTYSFPFSGPISIGNNGLLFITNGISLTTAPTNDELIISGAISGTGATVMKTGFARLLFNNANTYSGPTIINAGGLIMGSGGSIANSSSIQFDRSTSFSVTNNILDTTANPGWIITQPITAPYTVLGNLNLGSGAIMGTTPSTVTGALSLGSGSETAPGGTNLIDSITVSNGLALNGGHLTWEIGPSFETSDRIIVNGNLTLSGLTTFMINSIGGFDPSGTNTLITYTGSLVGGLANITNVNSSARFIVKFVDPATTPGKIQVYLVTPPADLVWKGNATANPTFWDIGTTTNWMNGVTNDFFFNADNVTFNDTAATNIVSLRGSLIGPGVITLNNNATNYVFGGPAGITAGALTNNGSGGLLISNSANNTFVGNGLVLNSSGAITFNQTPNATLSTLLNGNGPIVKIGTNVLTVVSPNSSNYTGSITVTNGTLRPGSMNALGGSGSTLTINSGGTLDINGQIGDLASVTVSGSGAVGKAGAIDNLGSQAQIRALTSLSLAANATLAATSNNWNITTVDTNGTTPGTFNGNNYSLTKAGAKDIWIATKSDTGLGVIDVAAGRLVFGSAGTMLGDSSSTVIVRTNAMLGFANGIQANAKPASIQSGGALYVVGYSNLFAGNMLITNGSATNCPVWTEPNGQLELSGNISGPGTLNLRSAGSLGTEGQLVLSGTNTYTGGTIITDGTLSYATTNAFAPFGTNSLGTNAVVLYGRTAANTSGGPRLGIISNVVSPASVSAIMYVDGTGEGATAQNISPAYGKCEIFGDGGTWSGPIYIQGSPTNPISSSKSQVTFSTGMNGFTIAGPISGTNFYGTQTTNNGACNLVGEPASPADGSGAALTFNGPLKINGSINNPSWFAGPTMPKVIFGAASNKWDSMNWLRGMMVCGADNGLPLAPIRFGTAFAGADHRCIIDLNGHSESIANLSVIFTDNDPFWIGSSSTNSNASLTYVGSVDTNNAVVTNIWGGFIVDSLLTNNAATNKTSLTVTGGYLNLEPIPSSHQDPGNFFVYGSGAPLFSMIPYSGPTIVSGGTLDISRDLGPSPVTVSGTGTLRGIGFLEGLLTVNSGGTLAPGSGILAIPNSLGKLYTNVIGTLTVSNHVTFNAGAKAMFRVNLDSNACDQLFCVSNITYGGNLAITVSNVGTQLITNGTVLQLFAAASYVPGTVTVAPLVPAPGLLWDTTQLAVDGTLRTTTVNTNPPTLTSVNSGNSLTLSWPTDHAGWRLQVQTNSLTTGINTNSAAWATVPNSTNVLSVTVPIVSTNPTVFYRMVYP